MARKAPKYKQGIFTPLNPHKYRGDVKGIIFRSGLEEKCFRYFDISPHVLEWNSEEVVVPYRSAIDQKIHRYFVDLWAKVKTKSGVIKEYLIEVKPDAQTRPPVLPKSGRNTKSYDYQLYQYVKNKSKWEYAEKYAKSKNMAFILLTEKDV